MSRYISFTLFGGQRSRLRLFPGLQRWLRIGYLRRRVFAVNLDNDMVLCRVLGRLKFFADAQDRSISPHLMMEGYWEPRTTETLIDLMRHNMVAIDAGANLGYFTLLMAVLCGARGHVLAFEPNPRMGDRLLATMMVNGLQDRVTFHQELLGATDGEEVNLIIWDNHPGGSQVSEYVPEGQKILKARTRRLDDFPRALEANLIKIDAEGSEEMIWKGMEAMIAGPNLRYVIIEFTPASYLDPNGMLDEVEAAGFTITCIDDRLGIRPIARSEILDGTAQRMLLFRR